MDVRGAQKFRVSGHSLLLIIPLCVLLGASTTWNLWQYRQIEHQRLQSLVARKSAKNEAMRTEAETKSNQAQLKRNAARAEAKARMDQLYQEVENLSRINERLLQSNSTRRMN
jgi:hypothetical protein